MATQNQIDANRRNAQNSTGPNSPDGKAKSSMNALKTGIDAKSEILRFESAEEHAILIAEYYDRFQPVTPEERCLVDRLISSEWLHRRYSNVEGAVWEAQFDSMTNPELGVAYYRASDQLARVDRRLNSAQRNFDKALKELRAIQEKRRSAPAPLEIPAKNDAENTQVNPELGSFLLPQAVVETSPIAPPGTPPNPQNEVPDLPRAA